MSDRELLLEQLERLAIVLDELMPQCAELVRDALDLLREQEAVEPKKESDGNPERWASWWYVCGDCGEAIDLHDMYCRHCGRAVKWE